MCLVKTFETNTSMTSGSSTSLPKQPSIRVLIKRFLKICSKLTGGHPCRSVISIKIN